MRRNQLWRVLLLVAITLVACIFLLPSSPLFRRLPSWAARFLPGNPITLGLDLQGGIHLVLEVDLEKFLETVTEKQVGEVRRILDQEKIPSLSLTREGRDRVRLRVTKLEERDRAVKALSTLSTLEVTGGVGDEILLAVPPQVAADLQRHAVTAAVEKIRNRVDQFGVTEPYIVPEGERRIVVQLPGVRDPERAIALIGKTALLEFTLVDEEGNLAEALAGRIPGGDHLLYERRVDRAGNVVRTPLLVKRQAILTGDSLTSARVQIDQERGGFVVGFEFDREGARIFGEVTTAQVGRRLAIILDDTVYSAPVIQTPITGGRGQITGNFNEKEATDLAIVLRAGALPAPVQIVANMTVGASLGEDSIRAAVRASILGSFLVILFMIIYYRWSGVIADMALLLNILLMVGALAAIGATLTLPGIAGFALAIGMAVDSNVLILERIREELRLGKTLRSAIDAGYDKAFSSIFDSHITTLITAAALFALGTGPIKGFAVSLGLGVMINLYTAIVGTRMVYDWITQRWNLKTMSI